MWPLGGIITAAVVGAVVLTSIGILLAITLERRRHNKILRTHGLTRGLSRYHRPKLSANELNYSHITLPTTHLRRSAQVPYGIVSVGQEGMPTEDEEKHSINTNGRPDEYTEVLRPKNNKRLRKSFSGHPLYIPKTRHTGKLRKAVPLELLPKSPLSAITEFSDPPASAPLESSGFPAHSTSLLHAGPAVTRPEKYVSTQWPLAIANTRGSTITPTEVMEIAARESVLMRSGGGIPHLSGVSRSASALSMTSLAPDDPLPPLPTINTPRRAKSHDGRRMSTASLDTVGSSVLGTLMSSPMNNAAELNHSFALNRRAPAFDLALKREFATPALQEPQAKKTIHGLVTGKSIRSLHPCVDVGDSSPGRHYISPTPIPTIVIREESFKTIDASKWALPPLRVTKLRGQSAQANRHSMIEASKLSQWRAASDPATSLLAEDDVFAMGEALKRPNSVATGNPIQWDRQPSLLSKRHSLTSLGGPKRGHKRQNCIRITNLPVLDIKHAVQRLPDLREEQTTGTSGPGFKRASNTYEIKQPRPLFTARPSVIDYKSSPTPSPFKNAPILTPTPRPARKQYIQPPGDGTRGLAATSRPDSDVFDSNQMDMPASSPYNATPRHWPLSHILQIGTNSTPPSARPSERFESPILPSPVLSSSFLYPRKSLVKGPRSPRNSTQSNASNHSPLQNKQGYSYRVSKDRNSNAQNEVALNASVMALRGLNTDATLLNQSATRSYSPEISALPSPPLNKRILGLRTSSCAPSVSSKAPSPTSERQMSRGPSPLTNHGSSLNKLDRHDSTAGAKSSVPALHLPKSHLSISPSTRVPSMMSASGASIWEDASVRADSPVPEEDEHPLALRTLGTKDTNQRYLYPSRSSSRVRQQSQQFSFPTVVERDFGADDDAENNDASCVVQNLERVANSGQWDHKAHHRTFTIDAGINRELAKIVEDPVTPRTRREMDVFDGQGGNGNVNGNENRSRKEAGVGLGLKLKMDELIVGRSYLNR